MAKFTRRIKLLLGKFPSTASKDEGLTTYGGRPTDLYDEGHLHYFTFGSLSRMLTGHCGYSSIQPFGYWPGSAPLGRNLHAYLSRRWPGMFSELVVVAHR
jgi:hypothetical protein